MSTWAGPELDRVAGVASSDLGRALDLGARDPAGAFDVAGEPDGGALLVDRLHDPVLRGRDEEPNRVRANIDHSDTHRRSILIGGQVDIGDA